MKHSRMRILLLMLLSLLALSITGCKPMERQNLSTPAPLSVTGEDPLTWLPGEPSESDQLTLVYVTQSGEKYHQLGCQYLRESCKEMALSDAKAHHTPCSVCHPPS